MDVTLFHRSGVAVERPEVRKTVYTKDFSYGFYCTKIYSQAERWALRHNDLENGESPIVNLYRYTPNKKLKYKVFKKMTNEWLDFIAMCRGSRGITPHDYDIVEGPMADDQVWNHVDDFLSGRITRRQFWEYARYKNPTHQITFHTEDALKCLHFERMVEVDASH